MSSVNLRVKFNSKQQITEQKYSHIKIRAHLQQKQVEAIEEKYKEQLKVKNIPFLLFQMPEQLKEFQVPIFKGGMFTHEQTVSNGKIFHWGNLTEEEMSLFLKKIQKIYHLLTGLNNEAWLNFSFYDMKNLSQKVDLNSYENGHQQMAILLDGFKIEGNVNIDEKMVDTFKQLTEKISPQFNNSPAIALLELFSSCDIDLEFDSFTFLEDENLKTLFETLRFKEDPDDRILPALRKCEGEMRIFITLPKLFSVQISCECETLGTLFSFL